MGWEKGFHPIKNLRLILGIAADWINKHWIIKMIGLFVPTIWLPLVVRYLGEESILLLPASNRLSTVGWVLTIIIYVIGFAFNFLSSFRIHRINLNDDKKAAQLVEYSNKISELMSDREFLKLTLGHLSDICENKAQTLREYIERHPVITSPFMETVQPLKQLMRMSESITTFISEVSLISKKDIVVSMAYILPTLTGNWRWVEGHRVADGLELSELINNPNTTFYRACFGSEPVIFEEDKQVAEANHRYVFDEKDKTMRSKDGRTKVGSIFVKRIVLESSSKKLVKLILSISTYGKKLVDDSRTANEVFNIIDEYIIGNFEKRIDVELANLYIKKLLEVKESQEENKQNDSLDMISESG